ncbi:MAG TPA: hypothetical protein VFE14_05205 [Micromonosporaceae bacterium]|jgi:hypothetical protein|nr:hypothetical protein [Micromonosporaceae bacterium]
MNASRFIPGLALAAVLFAGSGALAGCASATGGSQDTAAATHSASPPPGGSMTPVPPPSPGPSPQPSHGGLPTGEITMTGEVELMPIEGGCLVLRVAGRVYELMGGDRNMLRDGAMVSVRGRIRTDVVTTCQVGPVLEVLQVHPA